MPFIRLNYHENYFLFNPDKKEDRLRTTGKFSSVYKGIREEDGKTVIIKKFNPAQKSVELALERFKQEASIRINHSGIANNICFIHNAGHDYLVREYVEGEDILTYVKRSKLKGNEKTKFILRCAIEILNALDAVHQSKIIHCDIRPHNILLQYNSPSKEINSEQPTIKLIDFGLAYYQENPIVGIIPFSLIYSPPEQLLNVTNVINASSDLHSLAISLYELLTGEKPFYQDNPEFIIQLQLTQQLKPNKAIPDVVFQLLLKATNKHQFRLPPNRYKKEELIKFFKVAQSVRFQSAVEFKTALVHALKSLI